jgi:hypothetical protein
MPPRWEIAVVTMTLTNRNGTALQKSARIGTHSPPPIAEIWFEMTARAPANIAEIETP